MEKPAVAAGFFDLLQQSNLLSPERLASAREQSPDAETPARDLAKSLVESGFLTRFQAERLLDGRYRGFFIERYKLLEVLGVGGMGFVYIAHDQQRDCRVALKVLTDVNELDSGMLTRLEIEAHAGMMLDHPNIVKTSRIENTGAKRFVEMEYVRSLNLHEMIALAGPVKSPQACDMMMQAAAGLHHAHKAGLIHRDVKPANFLIDKNGRLKVLDFGLALATDQKDEEFSLAMIFGHECLGTADFIAPEQIEDSLQADARSDVYGLGCTMYATLTGKVPFPYPTNARKLAAQKSESPKPLAEVVPDLPADVAAIVEKMMAKDPKDRFQSAALAGRALQPWAKRKQIQFSMNEILTIRANHAQRKRQSQTALRSSEVTSQSAWTNSAARLSGTLQQQGVETAVARDTLPLRDQSPDASQPLRIMPEHSTAEMARAVTDQLTTLPAGRSFVLTSADGKTVIPLSRGRMTIGRDLDCEIPLQLPGISGRHCELSFDGDGWHIVDLGSKNGVQIAGDSVKSAELPVGCRITIALQHHFRIVDLSDGRQRGNRLLQIAGWSVAAAAIAGSLYWFFAR